MRTEPVLPLVIDAITAMAQWFPLRHLLTVPARIRRPANTASYTLRLLNGV